MKKLFGIATLVALLTQPAFGQELQQRLESALGVEWYFANCAEAQTMPATIVMAASMVINGTPSDVVDPSRQALQEKIISHFATTDDACAAFATNVQIR